MMLPRREALTALLLCLMSVAGLSSCLARRRVISQKGAKAAQGLRTANRDMLLQQVAKTYEAVQNFSATVDMVPALGSAEKSRITEYKDVRAFIRFRKPEDIRIVGLYPVVRNTAFDMVSNGTDFKLYIPARNRFIVGRNELSARSPNKLENLRPQHFLEALLVRPPDTSKDHVMLENFTDEDNAFYILHEVRARSDRELMLNRTIWFNRMDLQLAREMTFDDLGNILTDARYSDWRTYDNVPFPKHIEINRPRDEYAVVIDIVKMEINKEVPATQFVLEQPAGTTLQVIGPPPAKTESPAAPPKGKQT